MAIIPQIVQTRKIQGYLQILKDQNRPTALTRNKFMGISLLSHNSSEPNPKSLKHNFWEGSNLLYMVTLPTKPFLCHHMKIKGNLWKVLETMDYPKRKFLPK
jgi:hypothetical protein